MSALSSDLHRAIVSVWAAKLDQLFQTSWSTTERTRFVTLNETEAAPGTPLPHCVFEQIPNNELSRMSGGSADETGTKRKVRGVPILFHIYAKQDGATSAKAIAESLFEEVLGVYGGHPTKKPTPLTLTHGSVINCQYRNDYPVREGDTEHRWVIEYMIYVDTAYLV